MRIADPCTATLVALVVLAGAPVAHAAEAARPCLPVCAATCIKPISIADRWDDLTVIAGHEAWANNRAFDAEPFVDFNGNGRFDIGETWTDENANGSYDAEAYHPTLTGYVPDPVPGNMLAPEGDLGRLLRLRPDPGDKQRADVYAAIVFPAIARGAPERGARAYREALAGCRSADVRVSDRFEIQPGSLATASAEAFAAMVAGDPGARWDPATRSVVGQREPDRSSRIVLVGLHDPRQSHGSGRGEIRFTKLVAFFIEEPGADGALAGRLLKLQAAGIPCNCTCTLEESFLRDCR